MTIAELETKISGYVPHSKWGHAIKGYALDMLGNIKAKPYCCTHQEWLDCNYGIRMDGVPFMACKSWEHMVRAYDVLKKRHPGAKWTMSNKTKGVY